MSAERFAYQKRFMIYNNYLFNSYREKSAVLIILLKICFRHTCIYLACKVEEFYVPITDYVHNVEGDKQEKILTSTAILNSELQTTQELQFHLIIHQPYRPVEGLLIDLKVISAVHLYSILFIPTLLLNVSLTSTINYITNT